jgi:O-antigen/teichoic acid export membrane protein
VNVIYARKFISRRIVWSFKGIFIHIKPIFILGIYMVLTNIYSVLPITLLGFLSNKLAVGYYYGANRIIRMVISVFTSLITVMVPRLNQVLEEKGKNEYTLLVNKSLNIVISFGIPLTFLVFLLANPIVRFLAGQNFINSIVLVQIMAPIILIVAFAQVFVLLILSVNRKDNAMVLLSVIGMGISLIVNIIFIPHFAERATAISQLAAELLVTLVSFFLARKVLNFVFPVKKFILNLVFVIPFSAITYFSYKFVNNNFLVLTMSGFGCSLYFLFYQLFIIKDQFIHELLKPYLLRLGNNRFP